MSRESLAHATNSADLGMEPGVIHDADRLAAMASGDTLGGLLLRFREGEQEQWGHRIVLILARRVAQKHGIGREIAYRAAAVALAEWRNPHCLKCRGAREVIAGNLRITCDACGGSGKQLWTDGHRRAIIGAYGSRIDAAVADAHKHMANSLGAYLGHATWRLK